MRHVLFVFFLFLGKLSFLSAQEHYLPLSARSESALRAYKAATYLGANVRLDAAKMEIENAIAVEPDFFMAYAYAYQALANDDQKPALLEKALAIDPGGFTEAEKIMRRQLLVWQSDPNAMPTEAMKALVAAYPNTTEAYEWACLHAFCTEKDPEASFFYARKLLALDPYSGPAYNSLGYYYLGKKEMDKAKDAFEKYLEIGPAEANAHDSMGDFHVAAGDYAKAAEYYDQAAALGMESAKKRAEEARATVQKRGN